MTNPMTEGSPSTRGRILAALYLFVIIAGITAQSFIADRMVVYDDAAKTAVDASPDWPPAECWENDRTTEHPSVTIQCSNQSE